MRAPTDRLEEAGDRLLVRPAAALSELTAELAPEGLYWGFVTTAQEALVLQRRGKQWAELLGSQAWLEETRVFNEASDLHWLGDRGVVLREAPEGAEGGDVIGGPGWLERRRRSRLWGEELGDTGTWYEERIPDPQVYEGIKPGAGNDLVFLRYVEYIRGGEVRYVRYLGLEGEAR